MIETCKFCLNKFESGIWLSPQFRDHKTLEVRAWGFGMLGNGAEHSDTCTKLRGFHFRHENVLLFCSEECKEEYLRKKIERIKVSYPKYYGKLMKDGKEKVIENFLKDKH